MVPKFGSYVKQEWRYLGNNKLMFDRNIERHACYLMECIWIISLSKYLLELCKCAHHTTLCFSNLELQFSIQSVAFTTIGSIIVWMQLSEGNLSIIKFPNMNIWDQMEWWREACVYLYFFSHNWRKCSLMDERNNVASILLEKELVYNNVEEMEPVFWLSNG